ncbi:MAG: DUF86 domain-containing protein [Anaerolineae bacterium]
MVLRRDSVTARIKELDAILQELSRYTALTEDDLAGDLSQRWIIERGLIAAATLILDVADHILVGEFGLHPTTYESSLAGLWEKGVITEPLYQQLKGLGSFRNVLVHLYQDVDPRQVWENYRKGMVVFPLFAQAMLAWLGQE